MLDTRVKNGLNKKLKRFEELESELNKPDSSTSPQFPELLRERGAMASGMELYREYLASEQALQEAEDFADGSDPEMAELACEEIPILSAKVEELSLRVIDELLGSGTDPNRAVILEIRAGTGGAEAALFAGDLARMYHALADNRNWKFEEVSMSPAEQGGYKEVIFAVSGKNAWRDLRLEGGGHRVQRVPVTESQGRVHTSAATVAVLPEVTETEIDIRPEDLRIEVCRSGGPGGQSVNTTDSAVRIVHIPTGMMVFMQEEKSQHKNKSKAMRILRSRLYEAKMQEEASKRAKMRRGQTGTGDRSERIRTYNFPQNRVTDHRLNRNFSLDELIDGNLDKMIEALVEYGRQQEIAEASEQEDE